MQGSVGWLCPKCGSVISPYDQTCAKCAPVRYVPGTITLAGLSGTYTFGGSFSGGTIFAAPAKTDAQKLAEAKADRDKYKRKAEKYSAWADKLIEFYEQLNELTEELDELTNEPDEIEDD